MSIASSYSFILQKPLSSTNEQRKKDNLIVDFSQYIYNMLNKKKTSLISRNELIEWTKTNYFTEGVTNINDILIYIYEIPINTTSTIESIVKDDNDYHNFDIGHNGKDDDDDVDDL